MKIARIITDLSYGDAGKGTTIDFLARQVKSSVIVRYNGGPQAAHNVITPDGRHHTFAQFGSGSFVPNVVTHLSEDMLVNPFNMQAEAEHLVSLGVNDIWNRITIDSRAKVITPWHVAVNRLRENSRGGSRHGSCALGVGETVWDSIKRSDLALYTDDLKYNNLPIKLEAIRKYKLKQAIEEFGNINESDEWKILTDTSQVSLIANYYLQWSDRVRVVKPGYLVYLADVYDQILFEGAQGVLLDEDYGFHPYTTWSHATPENALRQLADIRYNFPIEKLGLVRAYTTRHGPGPFVTEDSGLEDVLREYHNGKDQWQGAFRYGHFDAVAHRYAIKACGQIDKLVITGLDRAQELAVWKIANDYSDDNLKERFFDMANGLVNDIKLGPRGDLDYQQKLGEQLMMARPVYSEYNNVAALDIAKIIQDSLNIPIGIASYGPTANEKKFM